MIKKKVTVILLSAFMVISTLSFSSITAKATGASGWQKNGTTWNYLVKGNKATNWIKVNSKWYFLKSDGVMVANDWIPTGNGKWYYLNSNGEMAIGWKQLGTTWYYLNTTSGTMQKGWAKVNGKWYFLNTSGDMAVNTKTIDHYTVGADGVWDGKVAQELVYNGEEIEKQLASLGFTDTKSIKTTLKQGTDQFITFELANFDGFRTGLNPYLPQSTEDMSIRYTINNPEMDKIKTIINWILPTKGNDLYTILESSTVKNQTIDLDRRTVTIDVKPKYIDVFFSATR